MCHSDSTPTLVDIRPRPRRWPAIVASALAFALATALLVGQGTSIREARDCSSVCQETGAAVVELCAGAAAVCSAATKAEAPAVPACEVDPDLTLTPPGIAPIILSPLSTTPARKAIRRRQPKIIPPTDPVEDADHDADPMRLRAEDF